MPVYNCAEYLSESVDSILNQSFTDFEFLIINDASTDNTKEILAGYKDQRIVYLENQENKKLAACLNVGIKQAKGKYIVRMDGDDRCVPNRIEKLVRYMEENISIDICSSWLSTFQERQTIFKYPESHDDIVCGMLFNSNLAHPASIWRKDSLLEKDIWFDESIRYGQDYDFWVNCIMSGLRFGVIPEVLYHYRIVTTEDKSVGKRETVHIVRLRQLSILGINPNNTETQIHLALAESRFHELPTIWVVENWLIKLNYHNNQIRFYNNSVFKKLLDDIWFKVFNTIKLKPYSKFRTVIVSDYWSVKHKIAIILSIMKNLLRK